MKKNASLSLVAGALALGVSMTAAAVEFNIPPQSLDSALLAFSEQANVQVSVSATGVVGIKTDGIAGDRTPEEALSTLLKNTGLKFTAIGKRTYSVTYAKEPNVEKTSEAASVVTGIRLAQAENQTEGATNSAEDKVAPALEEIVVTAEKRAENIQDLPIAISAFSGETLADRGIEELQVLQQIAPSLQFGGRQAGFTTMTMRGVGSHIGALGGDPSIAIVQDGVPYGSQWLTFTDFLDVERVEVLRGPQGTISGRNATAGAIHVNSKRPTDTPEGSLKGTIGNRQRLAVEGYLSGPILKDRLLGRVAVRSDRADGWVRNTLLNQDLGSIDKLQVRGSFLARLTDDLEADLIVEAFRDRSSQLVVDVGRARADTPSLAEFFDVPAFDRDRGTIQQDLPTNTDVERYQVALKLGWDLGPSANLTATTGYVDSTSLRFEDADASPVPAIFTTPETLYVDVWQASQEITLTADVTDRLDLIVGGLYLEDQARLRANFWAPFVGLPEGALDLKVDQQLTSWGAYTQWRYRLTEMVRLSAGIRYTHDAKSYDEHSLVFDAPVLVSDEFSWSAWTPRFAVDYTPNDDLTLYATVSRGFKSGGVSSFSNPPNSYDPEYLWNYEAGMKGKWLEDRLSTAVTGFYMEYTDLQQPRLILEDGQFSQPTINAGSATITGVELEIDALLTDRFRVTFGGAWLDATFDELRDQTDGLFPELMVPEGPGGALVRDASGNRLTMAPKWKFNISGEYSVPLGVTLLGKDLQGALRASYAWQDKMFLSIFNDDVPITTEGSYGLINLLGSVGPADGSWQLSSFVNNLADRFYTYEKGAFVGFAPVPPTFARPGSPRIYGVSLAYRF